MGRDCCPLLLQLDAISILRYFHKASRSDQVRLPCVCKKSSPVPLAICISYFRVEKPGQKSGTHAPPFIYELWMQTLKRVESQFISHFYFLSPVKKCENASVKQYRRKRGPIFRYLLAFQVSAT